MPQDFMLTADERRLKQRKRRRLIVLFFVLLLLFVTGYFGGRPTVNAIKAWQARRHANKAFAYINQEKWLDARKEATAAYQLRSTEPEALRAVARFLSRTKQVEALEFWKQLRDRQSLTRQDLRDEAAVAIMLGEIPRADASVRALLADKPEPADWLLAAQLSIHRGVPEDSFSWLEKVLNDPRSTDREQFQAALLKLGAATAENQANEAWSRIEKLSSGRSGVALDALVVLARRALTDQRSEVPPSPGFGAASSGQSSVVDNLSHSLQTHPLAKAPQKLIALDLIEHADATQREAVIARAITEWKDSDAESQTALATWLNGKGEYQRELDTIPIEKAIENRDLFLQRLDALGALDRWSEVKQLLDADRFPLDPVIQKMYLARCNAQLGEKVAAENNWRRALEAAGGDPGKLVTLAEYAEKNGILDVAGMAYNAAVDSAPTLRAGQQGRLRVAQASRDTGKIHAVLVEMLRLWPNDPAIQNDEGYIRLLLGANSRNDGMLKEIEGTAEKLVQHDPASMPHRTLLALARLRQNRPQDALAVYANIKMTPRALTASALAVHAAVLFATGHPEDAKTEAQQTHIDNLLPEERALIENLRQ
jgi:hypothetical protein